MRAARPRSKPVVIELAGLPGAGKTSLADRVSLTCGRRRDIPLTDLPLSASTWRVFAAAFALAFSIRPFRPRLLVRAVSLVLTLRAYGPGETWPLVVMDQGLVQKVWSMLIEKRHYAADRLERLVLALVPFLADHLVWVSVQPDAAARRIASRQGGNSRFDRQTPEEIAIRLRSLEHTYTMLVAMFDKAAGLAVTRIDGEADLAANAARIDSLASACMRSVSSATTSAT